MNSTEEICSLIRGLPPAQRKALDAIAVNEQPESMRSADALVRKGLAMAQTRVLGGRLPIRIKEYDIASYAVHMAWCEVCCENEETSND